MALTLVQIREQIEKLEKQAENIKPKEVADVVGRIRVAIEFYGLTAADLFGTKAKKAGRPKGTAGVVVKKAAKKPGKKEEAIAKYADPASGKTWTGHGKRPGWFVEAIAAGKTAEELSVKA
jgi:DNA-binding protein H-NS